jgi:hypothetical protein
MQITSMQITSIPSALLISDDYQQALQALIELLLSPL